MESKGLEFKKEIKIPVPWGHMSAKIWGNDDGDPVLALHGWRDNAGSFDTLAPLIPLNIQLVCLEFCGHGLSSHYPPGMFLTYYDHISHVKIVADYFKWNKFTIIGHSMGGIVAIHFTAMFPERVDKLVSLDRFKMESFPPENFPVRMRSSMADFEKVVSKIKRGDPTTTIKYNTAREKLVKNYEGSVDEKSADIILARNLKKKGDDEYVYTLDMRTLFVPSIFHEFTSDYLKSIAREIRCPFLCIKILKSTSDYSEPKELHAEFVEIYRNTSSDFRYVEVDGTHHVHLNQPHVIAPYICDFLSS